MLQIDSSISVIGEAMLELTHPTDTRVQLGYGGDTLNTCVYLAQLGLAPRFISAVGTDPYSEHLVDCWHRYGVLTDCLLRHPSRLPGIYSVQTDEQGERDFFYWRDSSAARDLFTLPGIDDVLHQASQSDCLYLSGITLSIFKQSERQRLLDLASKVRQRGGLVVFDPNYRARGWDNPQQARAAMMAIAPFVSMVMPTLDDEHALYGHADNLTHASRWLQQGVSTVVIKDGARGAFIYQPNDSVVAVPVPEAVQPIDTTGAGDSFNAGFITAKLAGAKLFDCAIAGHVLAARVIQHPGAIVETAARDSRFYEFLPKLAP